MRWVEEHRVESGSRGENCLFALKLERTGVFRRLVLNLNHQIEGHSLKDSGIMTK